MLSYAALAAPTVATAVVVVLVIVVAYKYLESSPNPRGSSRFEPIPGLLRGRELEPVADPRDLASFRTAAAARGPWPWPWPENFRGMTSWVAAHRSWPRTLPHPWSRSRFSDGASVHTNPRLAEELAATQYRGSYGVNSVGENVVTEQRLLDIYASQ